MIVTGGRDESKRDSRSVEWEAVSLVPAARAPIDTRAVSPERASLLSKLDPARVIGSGHPGRDKEHDDASQRQPRFHHRLHGGIARRGLLGVRRLRAAELYDAWLFAETDATLALAAWFSAPSDQKRDAYAAYSAALEREAHAAGMLELRLAPVAA